MRKILLPLLLMLAASGCGATPFGAGSAPTVVRYGTSFGMCAGRCLTELAVTENQAVLTRSSREPDRYPTLTQRLPIDPSEWAAIRDLANPRVFAGLQEVYGCPDCADGGAEIVELEADGELRRVVFEYGSTVEGIGPLIERLRAMRARFPDEAGG